MAEPIGNDVTIGEELRRHLRARGLPEDSGVSLRWVTVRFLGVKVAFPNFDARRVIVVAHDVHHLLTGYDTTWRGEGEIGGFELASGCRHLWAAWLFNLFGFLFGLCLVPVRTWRAFVRGRRCRNFYGEPTAAVLARRVDSARQELGLDRDVGPGGFADGLAFVAWIALVALVVVAIVTVAVLSVRQVFD